MPVQANASLLMSVHSQLGATFAKAKSTETISHLLIKILCAVALLEGDLSLIRTQLSPFYAASMPIPLLYRAREKGVPVAMIMTLIASIAPNQQNAISDHR